MTCWNLAITYQLCEPAILKQCGEITDNLFNRWERRLLEDDIALLVRFRKEKFPEIDKYFRDLDFLSAQIVLKGLVAYGWTYEELGQCRGDLMTQLFQHVDREQLASGQIQALCREPSRKRRRLEHESTSMELLACSDAQQLDLNAVGSYHEQLGADEDITDDEEMSNEDDGSSPTTRSTSSDVTSVGASLGTSADQAANPRQDHQSRVDIGIEQQSMTDKLMLPSHPVSALVDEQANGVYLSLQSFDSQLTRK